MPTTTLPLIWHLAVLGITMLFITGTIYSLHLAAEVINKGEEEEEELRVDTKDASKRGHRTICLLIAQMIVLVLVINIH